MVRSQRQRKAGVAVVSATALAHHTSSWFLTLDGRVVERWNPIASFAQALVSFVSRSNFHCSSGFIQRKLGPLLDNHEIEIQIGALDIQQK